MAGCSFKFFLFGCRIKSDIFWHTVLKINLIIISYKAINSTIFNKLEEFLKLKIQLLEDRRSSQKCQFLASWLGSCLQPKISIMIIMIGKIQVLNKIFYSSNNSILWHTGYWVIFPNNR